MIVVSMYTDLTSCSIANLTNQAAAFTTQPLGSAHHSLLAGLIHESLVLGFSHPDDLGIIHEDRDASAAPHPRTCSLSFFPSMAMDITVSEYYGRVLIDT